MMKFNYKKILIVAAAMVAISASVGADNLLQNPGFEEWDQNGNPIGWEVENGVTIQQEATTVHRGQYSISLSPTSNSNRGVYQDIEVTPGYYYTYSVWVYGSGTGSDGIGMGITWYSTYSDGTCSGYISSPDYPQNSQANQWEFLYILNEQAPSGAHCARVRIRGYKNNGFAGYADDASFSGGASPVEEDGILPHSDRDLILKIETYGKNIKVHLSQGINCGSISLFDITGRRLYRSQIDGHVLVSLPRPNKSGVFFVRVDTDKYSDTRKLLLLGPIE